MLTFMASETSDSYQGVSCHPGCFMAERQLSLLPAGRNRPIAAVRATQTMAGSATAAVGHVVPTKGRLWRNPSVRVWLGQPSALTRYLPFIPTFVDRRICVGKVEGEALTQAPVFGTPSSICVNCQSERISR